MTNRVPTHLQAGPSRAATSAVCRRLIGPGFAVMSPHSPHSRHSPPLCGGRRRRPPPPQHLIILATTWASRHGFVWRRDPDAEPRPLAKNGVRFTNFYTHASCSPTRSMLLSGVDTHLNGLGNMTSGPRPTRPACPGTRASSTSGRHDAAAAEGSRLSHLHGRQVAHGQAADQIPAARGFERDFSLLDGGGSYWDMSNVTAASPKLVFTRTAAT